MPDITRGWRVFSRRRVFSSPRFSDGIRFAVIGVRKPLLSGCRGRLGFRGIRQRAGDGSLSSAEDRGRAVRGGSTTTPPAARIRCSKSSIRCSNRSIG